MKRMQQSCEIEIPPMTQLGNVSPLLSWIISRWIKKACGHISRQINRYQYCQGKATMHISVIIMWLFCVNEYLWSPFSWSRTIIIACHVNNGLSYSKNHLDFYYNLNNFLRQFNVKWLHFGSPFIVAFHEQVSEIGLGLTTNLIVLHSGMHFYKNVTVRLKIFTRQWNHIALNSTVK